jgi:hypothetical protein
MVSVFEGQAIGRHRLPFVTEVMDADAEQANRRLSGVRLLEQPDGTCGQLCFGAVWLRVTVVKS